MSNIRMFFLIFFCFGIEIGELNSKRRRWIYFQVARKWRKGKCLPTERTTAHFLALCLTRSDFWLTCLFPSDFNWRVLEKVRICKMGVQDQHSNLTREPKWGGRKRKLTAVNDVTYKIRVYFTDQSLDIITSWKELRWGVSLQNEYLNLKGNNKEWRNKSHLQKWRNYIYVFSTHWQI